jgi:hypothetical protein
MFEDLLASEEWMRFMERVRSLLSKAIRHISYRAINTFHIGYKNQSICAVSGIRHCLFSDKYKTHKYSASIAYSC